MAEIGSRLGGRVNRVVAKAAMPKRIFSKGDKAAAVLDLPKAKRRVSEEAPTVAKKIATKKRQKESGGKGYAVKAAKKVWAATLPEPPIH